MANKNIKIGISENELTHNHQVADEAFEDCLNGRVEAFAINDLLNQLQWSAKDGAAQYLKYSKSHPDSLRKATHPFSSAPTEEIQELQQIVNMIKAFNLVNDAAKLDGIAEGAAARSRIDTKKISQRASDSRKGNVNYERKKRSDAVFEFLDKKRAENSDEYIRDRTNAELAQKYLSSLEEKLSDEKQQEEKPPVGDRTIANYVKQYKVEREITLLTGQS